MGDRQTNSVIADGATPMSARPADDGRAKLIEMRSRRGESTHPRTATADPAAAPCYYPRLEVGMLRLMLAAGHYDRTEALRDGRVRAEGIDLTYNHAARGGDLLAHGSAPGVRRLGVLAGRVCSAPRAGRRRPRRDPGFSVALFPAVVHLRPRGLGRPQPGGPAWQARRCTRVPDDGRGVGARHPGRRLRGARGRR